MIYLDTETVGFVGPLLTIQWARDDGPIQIHHVWRSLIESTLNLIEMFCNEDVCAYNLPFDWFHLQRTHAILSKMRYASNIETRWPSSELYIEQERAAVLDCRCLRPRSALDLLLYLKRGPLQSLMQRDEVRVKRVPSALAAPLAAILDQRFQPGGIYFAKRQGDRWLVEEDEDDPRWSDLVLRFGASAQLKNVARYVLGKDVIFNPTPDHLKVKQTEWHLHWQEELNPWDRVLEANVDYWFRDPDAQRYAREDVEHLRALHKHFGSLPPGDDDSELAVAVACMRWRGLRLDLVKTRQLYERKLREMRVAPRSPAAVKAYLLEVMSDTEALALTSTEGVILETIAKWQDEEGQPTQVAWRAYLSSQARSAEKEADGLRKMLILGRAHFDFNVIGALSGRSSGAGGWSAHGTPKGREFRALFLEADEGEFLDAGDFESQEVTIAAAAYGDEQLTADLKSGKKIHAIFGSFLYEMSYEEVLSTKENPEATNLYGRGKNTVFARIYGAMAKKISETAGITLERAEKFEADIGERYPGMRKARERISSMFCSMSQPGGLGTEVVWRDPADSVSSLLGFKRYFTLENMLVKILYDLAGDMPPELAKHEAALQKVTRRERSQTAAGAVRSALYAAAFGLQAANMRAAANHEIQSTGAQITKALQRALWDLQPVGVQPWVARTMNAHDEVHVVRAPEVKTKPVVDSVIQRFRQVVPLLAIGWKTGVRSWADK